MATTARMTKTQLIDENTALRAEITALRHQLSQLQAKPAPAKTAEPRVRGFELSINGVPRVTYLSLAEATTRAAEIRRAHPTLAVHIKPVAPRFASNRVVPHVLVVNNVERACYRNLEAAAAAARAIKLANPKLSVMTRIAA